MILAVADNSILRRVLVRQLRNLGYAVLEAAHGRSAVELLRGSATDDLLLTDIVMPGGLDGSDLAQIALQIRPS